MRDSVCTLPSRRRPARAFACASALIAGCTLSALGACGGEDDLDQVMQPALEGGLPGVDAALPDAAPPIPVVTADAMVTNEAGPMQDAQLPTSDASAPRMDASVDASAPRDASGGMDAAPVIEAGSGTNPEPGRLAGITAAHNAARARVKTSMPLPPLTWSSEIATVAQAYAEKLAAGCSTTLVHSTPQERRGWGENLAMMGGFGTAPAGSAQQAVDLWESELSCYTFGPFQAGVNATCTSECSKYGGCGHYTQIVWRKTARVGCGTAECMSGSSKRAFWVCNYNPPGNYIGQTPY